MRAVTVEADPENRYLIAGVRGGFTSRTPAAPAAVGGVLLHTLERWGVSAPPWGPCDSDADLESVGSDVLRGWAHVDLGGLNSQHVPDAPVSALLRTTWDALELYGTVTLTGVDAIVPLRAVEDATRIRVANSVVTDADRALPDRPKVTLELDSASGEVETTRVWAATSLVEALAELVGSVAASRTAARPRSTASPARNPFRRLGKSAFAAQVTVPAWTIDDAAWLVEAAAVACRSAGILDDVQIVTRLAPSAS